MLSEIQGPTLILAWVGDSPCYRIDKFHSISQLTTHHNSCNEQERLRIENEGGRFPERGGTLRVNGDLAVTRAFGHSGPRPLISSKPEWTIIDAKEVSNLVAVLLVTDGVTGSLYYSKSTVSLSFSDVLNDSKLRDLVKIHSSTNDASHQIVKAAFDADSTDNLTALCINLPHSTVPA